MKHCRKCGVEKPLGEFPKNRQGPDGLRTICKKCGSEYSAKWLAENRERKSEYNAKWYAENRERKSEYNARWRAENPEYQREYHLEWRAENPDKAFLYGLSRVHWS